MIDRNDLKQFTRKELEDIILSKSGHFLFDSTILELIHDKQKEKHRAYETKVEMLQQERDEWLKQLKLKYQVSEDKELFVKMNYEEQLKYFAKLDEINNVFDEDMKLYEKERKAFMKEYGKK